MTIGHGGWWRAGRFAWRARSARALALLLLGGSCVPPGPAGGGKGGAAGGGTDAQAGGGDGGGGGGGNAGRCDPGSQDLEFCTCATEGVRRDCWTGPAGKAGVGACRMGWQLCQGATSKVWGSCQDAVLPQPEKCGDGVDNDCNGWTDCEDPACAAYCAGPDLPDRPPAPEPPPDAPPDLTPDKICPPSSSSYMAEKVPLDLYLMLDKSGSMAGEKWTNVTTAIKKFAQDPKTTGMGVALQYFSAASECDVSGYSSPAVGMGALPDLTTALVSSLDATFPDGDTPTLPAEQGALDYATKWKAAHPTHTVIVVLATDGEPDDMCGSEVDNVTSAAEAGCKGTPSIPTYVIGVGSSLTDLNTIAAGGCTKQAYLVNGGDPSEFLNAMLAIQQTIGCEYQIPTPSAGGAPDYTMVSVKYTPGAGGAAQAIKKVGGKAACDPATGGWYYDNDAAPMKIILCGASCGLVQGDPKAKVDIVLGCS